MVKRTGAGRQSRNKKAYWRKGTNVRDIEESLAHEKELQNISGRIAEKDDDQLFTISKEPSTTGTKASSTTRKASGKVDLESLKSFQNLQPNPLIKPAKTKAKSRPEKWGTLRSRGIKKSKPSQSEATKPFKSSKDKYRAMGIIGKTRKPKRRTETDTKDLAGPHSTINLWLAPEKPKDDVSKMDDEAGEYHLRSTGQKPVNEPITRKAPKSSIAHVEKPHPGTSYNPSFDDHQNLLQSVVTKEGKLLADEQKLARSLKPKFESMVTHEERDRELKEGLFGDEPSSTVIKVKKEEEQSEYEEDSYKPAVGEIVSAENRKTRSQRRKEQLSKEERKAAQKAKLMRQKANDVFKVKSLKKSIRAEEEKRTLKLQKRAIKKTNEEAFSTKTTSQNKFVDVETEFNLPTDIRGSLLHMKPEGSIITEKFKNLQKRNVIEVGKLQKKTRRYKRKLLQRPGHKEIDEDYVPK